MDKADLIKEVAVLCNIDRNLRVWMRNRATEFVHEFAEGESDREALKAHFCTVGEGKIPDWLAIVAEVYDPVVTEQELLLAKAELTDFRERGITDPPDDDLTPPVRDILHRLALLQPLLDLRMHGFLQSLIMATYSTYQVRN